jgi:hypothetical protein
MLPTVAAMTVSSQISPLLARRFRPAVLIGAGLLISTGGLLLIARAGATSGLPAVVTGFAVINLGSGPLVVLGTDLAAVAIAVAVALRHVRPIGRHEGAAARHHRDLPPRPVSAARTWSSRRRSRSR